MRMIITLLQLSHSPLILVYLFLQIVHLVLRSSRGYELIHILREFFLLLCKLFQLVFRIVGIEFDVGYKVLPVTCHILPVFMAKIAGN